MCLKAPVANCRGDNSDETNRNPDNHVELPVHSAVGDAAKARVIYNLKAEIAVVPNLPQHNSMLTRPSWDSDLL